MSIGSVYGQLTSVVNELEHRAIGLSLDIHANPELAFSEYRACSALTAWLADEGFTVTPRAAGLDTAFVATWGTGAPRIAFLLEYDALPEIGHGCGHNLIAAGGITAATAVRRALGDSTSGTLLVIGTPAEEGGGGKIIQLKAGIFDAVDAALMFHPGDRSLPWRHTLACVTLRVVATGTAAHASKNPEDGRNALTAVIQMFTAIDGLRQHIGPYARIHGIITNGGSAANVIPHLAEAELLVRHRTVAEAQALARRVRDCAQAAGLATGTSVTVTEPAPVYAERKSNRVIAEALVRHLADLQVPMEPPSEANPAGSSDVGNVSQRIPVIHPYLQIAPRGTPGHSPEFCAAAATPEAHQAMLQMAQGLSRTAADLFLDANLLARAREEFSIRGADLADGSSLPASSPALSRYP
jgi:amidohydrolase